MRHRKERAHATRKKKAVTTTTTTTTAVPIDLVDMHAFADGTTTAVEACEALYRSVGASFTLRFKRRTVPLVLRRGDVRGRVYFLFQIAYVIDESTAFSGMQIFVGASSDALQSIYHGPPTSNEAYIALIHALPLHRWRGSDMIELALGIARAMGVRRAALNDGTFHVCAKAKKTKKDIAEVQAVDPDEDRERQGPHRREPGYDLSMIMLLSRKITFYGRYGFVPTSSNAWDSLELGGDPRKDLCAALARLGRVRAASLKRYLRAMLHHLDRPVVPTSHRFVENSMRFGVMQVRLQPVAKATADLPERVKLMKRLLTALQPHDGLLLPLFGDGDDAGTAKTLSCLAKRDMLSLMEMGYPILRLQPDQKKEQHPTIVQWPAWRDLSQVAQIRSMAMEADVHPDPKLQRLKTFCAPT